MRRILKPGLMGAVALVVWILVGDAVYESFQGRLQACIDKKRDEHNFRGFADYDSAQKLRYYYESCRTQLELNKRDWPKAIWLKILVAPGYLINS